MVVVSGVWEAFGSRTHSSKSLGDESLRLEVSSGMNGRNVKTNGAVYKLRMHGPVCMVESSVLSGRGPSWTL